MGRLTQILAYVNSNAEDWTKTPVKIKYSDFTHFEISEESKKFRKWFKYSKESLYLDYLKNKE